MGSEGYLINQFLSPRTNQRERRLGRQHRRPDALAVEIVRRVRARGRRRDFIVMFRLSLLDLVEGGNTMGRDGRGRAGARARRRHAAQHRHRLARGAHPDDRHVVPRAAFAWRTRALKRARARFRWSRRTASTRPTSPKTSSPRGDADLVSMARPFLADPRVRRQGRRRPQPTTSTPASPATRRASTAPSRDQRASCLVNPRACRETELVLQRAARAEAHRRRRRRRRGARRARRSPRSAGIA